MLPMVEYVLEIHFMAIRIILTIISYQNDTLIVNLKIGGFMNYSSLLHQISGIKPYFHVAGVV